MDRSCLCSPHTLPWALSQQGRPGPGAGRLSGNPCSMLRAYSDSSTADSPQRPAVAQLPPSIRTKVESLAGPNQERKASQPAGRLGRRALQAVHLPIRGIHRRRPEPPPRTMPTQPSQVSGGGLDPPGSGRADSGNLLLWVWEQLPGVWGHSQTGTRELAGGPSASWGQTRPIWHRSGLSQQGLSRH